ncbi:TnsA endonuclease N-terminal domain-containing protein [Nautilia sp.]
MPVRKIPIQSKSVAGRFFSHKNNKLIDFESQLEKKCYLILEFDTNIVSYEPQPLKIENYIPDILAYRANDIPLLIEVKYSDEAFNPDEKLKRKFDALNKYAKENNLEFKIFTEQDIKEPYFSNINLIYNYAKISINDEIISNILKLIPKEGISIAQLLTKVNNEMNYLSHIYHLIFQKKLETNFNKKLSQNSILRINSD